MNKFILLCLTTFAQSAIAQQMHSFTLSGKINIDSGSIQLLPVSNLNDYPASVNFSSVPVTKGKFRITGQLETPVKLMLLCKWGGTIPYVSEGFFLDTGIQEITCKVDTSSRNREIPAIHNKPMDQYIPTWYSPEFLALDTVSDYQTNYSLLRKYTRNYAKKYPDSEISLWQLAEFLERAYEPDLDSGYTYLSGRIKSSYSGTQLSDDIKHLRLTAIGQTFPQVTCFDLSGKKNKFYNPEWMAKYILVDFWFSHCGPCLGQFPDFLRIVKTYQTKGFLMVGISWDKTVADIADWKQVIHEQKLTWQQYRTDETSIKNLRISVAPSNFLLDSQGMIIAKNLAPSEVEEFLKNKLN